MAAKPLPDLTPPPPPPSPHLWQIAGRGCPYQWRSGIIICVAVYNTVVNIPTLNTRNRALHTLATVHTTIVYYNNTWPNVLDTVLFITEMLLFRVIGPLVHTGAITVISKNIFFKQESWHLVECAHKTQTRRHTLYIFFCHTLQIKAVFSDFYQQIKTSDV